MNVDVLFERYRDYVATYRNAAGGLPVMMALKLEHTEKVVANARAIADGERFEPLARQVAEVAALLHDTGRYEQLKRYDTFRDSESVDHAVFSHDIVLEQGWLADMPTAERDAVLAAVLYHNRRELPGGLDALTAAAAKTVRDADKLDIFRVLEHQFETADWRHDSRAFWNLPVENPPTAAVCARILDGQPVDYNLIASLADFVLIQVGWMVTGLEYATSRRLCRERGHLAFRRRFLKALSDDRRIDEICDFAAAALNAVGDRSKGEQK